MVAFEEHVFGAAQANALRAEFAGHCRVFRRIGIGANVNLSYFVSPFHDGAEIARKAGFDCLNLAEHNFTG